MESFSRIHSYTHTHSPSCQYTKPKKIKDKRVTNRHAHVWQSGWVRIKNESFRLLKLVFEMKNLVSRLFGYLKSHSELGSYIEDHTIWINSTF